MTVKRIGFLLMLCFTLLLLAPLGVWANDAGLTPEQQSLYSQMLKAFIAPDFCGKSLEECPAGITVDMREGILQQVKDGATKEEIIAYWTGVYGERILAAPPKSGFYLSAWILPVVGIVAGVFILSVALKGRIGGGQQSRFKKKDVPDEYEEELQQEILKHL
jgi:cytochrome c-type biogenesis protein CcmH